MRCPSFLTTTCKLLTPSFDSPLVDVLAELEFLRRLRLEGDTPPQVFFQLKALFHTLESLGSARIEGNHTTLADYIDSKVEGKAESTDQLLEIANIEKAMDYIEAVIEPGADLTEHTIRELHAMTVLGLRREGDRTPGAYGKGRSGSPRRSICLQKVCWCRSTCRSWSASSIATIPLNTR